MVARELERQDEEIAILGTGVQARLQALLHGEVLNLKRIFLWGRTPARAAECRDDLRKLLPGVEIEVENSPAEAASHARLLITATGARQPLLRLADLQPGTHITAVGSDSAGKQELDPSILRQAALLLVDSRTQCEKLGELQHAPDQSSRAEEIGAYCENPRKAAGSPSVCDLTGLGVEDLYIAEYCYENRKV
jgi:ornithine cyclodeaminase